MSNKGLRKNKTLKDIIAKTNLEDSTYRLITRLNLVASLLPSFPIFGRTKTTKKTTHFDNNKKISLPLEEKSQRFAKWVF